MNLLGPYPSQLTSFHYQELLDILQKAVASGEFAGGSLFDSNAANTLQQQGLDFASLPVISAGTRAIADQINTPMATLLARFNALVSESTEFQTMLYNLLAVIDKDSYLVSQVLATALGNDWASKQPIVTGALPFAWNFASGYGKTANNIDQTDPVSGVVYPKVCPIETVVINNKITSGLVTPFTSTKINVKNLVWNYNFNGQTDIVSGDDWTQFYLLAPAPLYIYAPAAVKLIQPTSIGSQVPSDLFNITGQGISGNLPIYVQLSFTPRTTTIKFTAAQTLSTEPLQLSSYRVSAADVKVYDVNQTYALATDYTIDTQNRLIPNDIITINGITSGFAGRPVSVQFVEYFPSYQCSVNQVDWSATVMLDPDRLFPDNSTVFTPVPVKIVNGETQFPVMDELGVPLGFYITRVLDANSNPIVPNSEMLFSVTSPIAVAAGAQAELVVELQAPGYINSFYLEPFTSFPMTLVSAYLEGFADTALVPVITQPLLLTEGVNLSFPTTLVRKVHLNFIQNNYTLEEITIQPPDALRRNTLNNLQAVLPFAVRRTQSAVPQTYEGSEYDFGVQNMYGEYYLPDGNGVFIAGPITVNGMPEIIRLDIDYVSDSLRAYLVYEAYDENNTLIDTATVEMIKDGIAGDTIVYPSSVKAARVDFYIQFVLADPVTFVTRYLLQVSIVQ